MQFFVLIGIVFIGWLMWSTKAQKETFLGLAWALMMGVGLLNFLWLLLSR